MSRIQNIIGLNFRHMISAEVLSIGLKVAEIAVGAAVDFGEKVIPDEVKPREKPAYHESAADELRLVLIRSELGSLRSESQKPVRSEV